MQVTSKFDTVEKIVRKKVALSPCYHCGAACLTSDIAIGEKYFCCEGCQLVYEIINENDLCNYYSLQDHPGLAQIKPVRNDKYSFLDEETIANKLYQFTNGDLSMVKLYIPSIHCSSCMWLLEHLSRMDAGIVESRISFTEKEVVIRFYRSKISLRKVVELLATLGYAPYITLADTDSKVAKSFNRQRLIKLGIAGFCFGNIMMMSFPEYLSDKNSISETYVHLFRYLNLLLSLPVFFYSATEFYQTAWAGLKQKMLNIDAPIVLALLITFSRSIYEILTNTGAGYLDSMSGIVFFMLAGRLLQERTYKSLSFTRDYKSYFPIAVSVRTAQGIATRRLEELREKDIVILHHDEIIPADSIALNNNAFIDYSFVTGEAVPVKVGMGEAIYAGGKQVGEELIIEVIKPVAGSYLTSLWNHYAFKKNKAASNDRVSVIHLLSKYFTAILFTIAVATGAYWYFHDPAKIITSISAILIIACPCALLLSASFTNGNILRIFGMNGIFLRDATVIEQMANIDHIVFDKTGTITNSNNNQVTVGGHALGDIEKDLVYSVVKQSNHPNSKALVAWLGDRNIIPLTEWREITGKGLLAKTGAISIRIGSAEFTGAQSAGIDQQATVYIRLGDKITSVCLQPLFRPAIQSLINKLTNKYSLSLLSGDNARQKGQMRDLFGKESDLQFGQKPGDKLEYVQRLQRSGKKVMMVGDGLNDAGALQQSDVGITLTDDINNFTPACDAIIDAAKIDKFASLLDLAKSSRTIVACSFIISILYNAAGLYFAMRGELKPLVAAILMPCSTISIVIISSGLSNLIAWRKGLTVKA